MAVTLHKFSQFLKMEDASDGSPTVWGIATLQEPDCDNEICMYEDSKPAYEAWSAAAAKRTSGAGQEVSLGNIRLQHGMEVGGKATKLDFDDEHKRIMLGSEPISDEVRQALKKGMYTGYSQGGSYAYRKCADCDHSMPMRQGDNFCSKCKKNVPVNYALKSLAEVSYVDSPATGEGFEHVKNNGSREIIKFQKKEATVKATKTKEEMAALFQAWIVAKAAEKGFVAFSDRFQKGLYTVGYLAEVLQSISNIWQSTVYERDVEGDDSDVPEQLASDLEGLIETFLAMAEEEAKELAAVAASKTTKGVTSMTPEELEAQKKEQEALKAAKRSKASHFAKVANNHEKMETAETAKAAHHEGLRDLHKSMHEKMKKCAGSVKAAKADVGSGNEHDPIHEALADQTEFHKAAAEDHGKIAKECHKCAKAHGAAADGMHAVSEMNDSEEHEKAVKAFKAEKPEEPVVKAETKDDAEAAFTRTAVEKARTKLLNDPEFMAEVEKAQRAKLLGELSNVDAEVAAIRAKTVIPVGGNPDAALGKGLHVAARDAGKFDLVSAQPSGDFGGL